MATPDTYADPPRHNKLLAALPDSEWEHVRANLIPTFLRLGEAVYEAGATLADVYFPTNAIISLLYVLADGASAEIAVVGNEGLVGVALYHGR